MSSFLTKKYLLNQGIVACLCLINLLALFMENWVIRHSYNCVLSLTVQGPYGSDTLPNLLLVFICTCREGPSGIRKYVCNFYIFFWTPDSPMICSPYIPLNYRTYRQQRVIPYQRDVLVPLPTSCIIYLIANSLTCKSFLKIQLPLFGLWLNTPTKCL